MQLNINRVKSSEEISYLTDYMTTFTSERIELFISKDHETLSRKAGELVVQTIDEVLQKKRQALFVPSAGNTPKRMYEIIAHEYKKAVDWKRVIIAQMDEYSGLSCTNKRSFANFLSCHLVRPLGIHTFLHFNDTNGALLIPLTDYETKIEALGGIDLVVHGIGGNGHLAFNEPGSFFDSKTREVSLDSTTIAAAIKVSRNRWKPPNTGVTLGLHSLACAKSHILMASGSHKKIAMEAMLCGPKTSRVPATMLQTCSPVRIVVDSAALSKVATACLWAKQSTGPSGQVNWLK